MAIVQPRMLWFVILKKQVLVNERFRGGERFDFVCVLLVVLLLPLWYFLGSLHSAPLTVARRNVA